MVDVDLVQVGKIVFPNFFLLPPFPKPNIKTSTTPKKLDQFKQSPKPQTPYMLIKTPETHSKPQNQTLKPSSNQRKRGE